MKRESIPDLTNSALTRPPAAWASEHLEGLLITTSVLQDRVTQLANEIAASRPREEPLLVLSLLSGAFLFTADLVRHWTFPFELDFIKVASYGSQTLPGELSWKHDIQSPVKDKHLLILDDILDTGQTLHQVTSRLQEEQPASIRTCVCLEKNGTQARPFPFHADHVGFIIPDRFVIGYGLDFDLKFRQFPFIGVLNPDAYASGNH
jgi:hypoxanthine phosphoribosyltransferase